MQVMLTQKEYLALLGYAESMDMTMSEVVRDFIRKLKTYAKD